MNRESRRDGFSFYVELGTVFAGQFFLPVSEINGDRYTINHTISDDSFEDWKKQMNFYSLGRSRMTGRNKLIVNN